MASLSHGLLFAAEFLLGGEQKGSATRRRAASTAYYALFHRLSALCASQLMGAPEATPMHWRAYRALEHRQAREALTRSEEFKARIGTAFAELQDIRQWADYSSASHPDEAKAKLRKTFVLGEARDCVARAREAIDLINRLDKTARRRLTTLLLVRDRR